MLFVYGTLRDPELLGAVLGRPAIGLAATAPGFAAVHYPGRTYPALVRRPGAAAPGLVLTDLSAFEMDLLDAFEGTEYRRAIIPVMIGEELHEAFTFLPAVAVTGQHGWTLEAWQAEHKARALPGEQAAAEALRRKLLAIRPH
jgi:gamma-glutamylcyclotransferase (GGCT)/AIG2-like uncharacterized protein YtfP